MRNVLSYALSLLFVSALPSVAFAGDLQANDFVGVTFWIISISMVAATLSSSSLKDQECQLNGKHRYQSYH